MNKTKKAFWIVYVFFLITLILSFWVIVLNKQSFFEKSVEFMEKQDFLSKNILDQANISFKNNHTNNEHSWSYKPFISCPEDLKMYSWSELISTGKTIFNNNLCNWTLNGEVIHLFFTWSYDTFSSWVLWWTWFQLSWENILTWAFSQYEIFFNKPISFDDRFIKARTQIQWTLTKWDWFQNIFWSNQKIANFIDTNTNNIWPFTKLSQIQQAVLYFEGDESFSWKIIQFDKNIFNNQNKLLKVQEFNFSSQSWSTWYLQENLTLSWAFGTPKFFDFHNNDYAIFLSYNTWVLNNIWYTFKVMTENWTWTYINPIRDDREISQYLWNNILMKDNQFYYKIQTINNY